MLKRLFLALSFVTVLASPALAESLPFDMGSDFAGMGGQGTAGDTGEQFHETETTNTWADYEQMPVEGHPVQGGNQNFQTGKQVGGFGGSYGGGPLLMGANSSAPFPGSTRAPGNFALRQQGKKNLPPTVLDSFVNNSGRNPKIYGDEGTYGPPPFFSFNTIDSGITSGDLSTGHRSALPSAWY